MLQIDGANYEQCKLNSWLWNLWYSRSRVCTWEGPSCYIIAWQKVSCGEIMCQWIMWELTFVWLIKSKDNDLNIFMKANLSKCNNHLKSPTLNTLRMLTKFQHEFWRGNSGTNMEKQFRILYNVCVLVERIKLIWISNSFSFRKHHDPAVQV